MTDDDEVLACPDCDRTPVVANAPGGRSHGSSEKYRCARCGWKGDEPRRRPSRGDPDLRADSIAAKLDEADSLDELVTDGGVDQEDGVIAQIDRYGICENCGHHAVVVRHGHEAPDGGSVNAWDDEVRCELTRPGGEAVAE